MRTSNAGEFLYLALVAVICVLAIGLGVVSVYAVLRGLGVL